MHVFNQMNCQPSIVGGQLPTQTQLSIQPSKITNYIVGGRHPATANTNTTKQNANYIVGGPHPATTNTIITKQNCQLHCGRASPRHRKHNTNQEKSPTILWAGITPLSTNTMQPRKMLTSTKQNANYIVGGHHPATTQHNTTKQNANYIVGGHHPATTNTIQPSKSPTTLSLLEKLE